MELIYNALKASKNTKKHARELLSSELITELSDIPRQNKGTRAEKLPSKGDNETKTMQGA